MNIEINIPAEAIEKAIVEAMTKNYVRLDGKTSLGVLVTKAIEDRSDALRERVDTIVRGAIASDELERRIRQAFRNSVVAEAEKIGRKVAKAIAMKECE